MTDSETRAAYALALRLTEPCDHLFKVAVQHCGIVALIDHVRTRGPHAVEAVFEAAHARGLNLGPGAAYKALNRWHARLTDAEPEREIRLMARIHARIVTPQDAEWPASLSVLGLDEPLALWVRGPLTLDQALQAPVAVVGTRAASDYGARVTNQLVGDLTNRGHTIVSGGALGIDAAAHDAALRAHARSSSAGTTVALLANGIDSYYPRMNADLLAQVAEQSLVISESPPGDTARKHRFLDRNRLIAALSQATVVIEAGWRSGALHTAHRAAEMSRPVGAVPGSVFSADSRGCHRLIREGAATLVTEAADVEELIGPIEIRPESDDPTLERPTDGLDDFELRVYDALPQRGGADPSALAVRAGLDIRQALAGVAALELYGLAEHAKNGWIKAKNQPAASRPAQHSSG